MVRLHKDLLMTGVALYKKQIKSYKHGLTAESRLGNGKLTKNILRGLKKRLKHFLEDKDL